MSWTIDYEKCRVIESASGEHEDEPGALAALASSLHVIRDDIRKKAADPSLCPMEARKLTHRVPTLEVALARVQRRRRELGVKTPPSWEAP